MDDQHRERPASDRTTSLPGPAVVDRFEEMMQAALQSAESALVLAELLRDEDEREQAARLFEHLASVGQRGASMCSGEQASDRFDERTATEKTRPSVQPALLTVAQAAAHIQMSLGFVEKAIEGGELAHVELAGVTRVRLIDLEKFVEEHTREAKEAVDTPSPEQLVEAMQSLDDSDREEFEDMVQAMFDSAKLPFNDQSQAFQEPPTRKTKQALPPPIPGEDES